MNVERWGWYSVALNIALAVSHATVALASGSLAISAEFVHNAVDLFSAIVVLAGIKIATRKSKTFPYGLYKVENVVAAGLSGLIFLSAYEISREALFVQPEAVNAEPWMLGVLAVTGVSPLVFSHFELRVGRAANSPALIADAKEYRVHVLTTGLAFTALASQRFDIPMDRAAALIIVVAIAWTGWGLLRDALRVLLDASLDAEILRTIEHHIADDPAVGEVRWITGRNAGRFCFVEAGVTLRVEDARKAETVLERIEADVLSAVPCVERVLLHLEAPAPSTLRYAVPLDDREGKLSEHFGDAPFFALVSIRAADGAVEDQRIVTNPHSAERKARGIRVANWLVNQSVDRILLRKELAGKGPAFVFHDAGIVSEQTVAIRLADVFSRPRPE